jgi:hypothetical protein
MIGMGEEVTPRLCLEQIDEGEGRGGRVERGGMHALLAWRDV